MELRSRLAEAMRGLMEFRTSQGFFARKYESILMRFDRYCAQSRCDDGKLTQSLVTGWLMSEERQGKGELRSKAVVLRALANYINAFGGSAYVLPARLVPGHKAFAPHVFDDGELSRLFAEVDRASREGFGTPAVPEMYSVALRLTYVCGLRPGEGIRARVSELDLESGTLKITKAKSHKERIVALSEDMRRLLQTHVRNLAAAVPGYEYLFPGRDRERPVGLPEVRSFFTRCWRRACHADAAGDVPRTRLYDLRHRFASAVLQKWLDEGRNIYEAIPSLRTYMGHTSLSSTLYYVHLIPENLLKSRGVDWARLNAIVPEVGT